MHTLLTILIFKKIKYNSKRLGIENAPTWDTVDGNAQHNVLQQSSQPKPQMPNQSDVQKENLKW